MLKAFIKISLNFHSNDGFDQTFDRRRWWRQQRRRRSTFSLTWHDDGNKKRFMEICSKWNLSILWLRKGRLLNFRFGLAFSLKRWRQWRMCWKIKFLPMLFRKFFGPVRLLWRTWENLTASTHPPHLYFRCALLHNFHGLSFWLRVVSFY